VGTAQNLTKALQNMSERLDAAVARERQTRRIAWGLAISLAIDIAVTVVVALTAVAAHSASDSANAASMRASHASASNLALCRASNVARAQQLGIWVYLLHLTGPARTAQGRELVTRFERHLAVVFRARDCATLGRKKP
jgi:hypothetical protein